MIYNRDAIDRSGMIENMLRRKAEQNAEQRRLMAERNQIWQDAISAGGRLADKMFSDEDKLRQLEAERAALDEQNSNDQTSTAQKADWSRSPFETSSTRSEVNTGAQPTWLEEATRKAMEEFRKEKRLGALPTENNIEVGPLPPEYRSMAGLDDRRIEDAIVRAKLEAGI